MVYSNKNLQSLAGHGVVSEVSPGHPVVFVDVPWWTHCRCRVLVTPVIPQEAEHGPHSVHDVQIGHPLSHIHCPTLVAEPGHPVVNWLVPEITHLLCRFLVIPDPHVAAQDPHAPHVVQTGHPALLQFIVSDEPPGLQLVGAIGFPLKIHCLDLVLVESLPHDFVHVDQFVQLAHVGQAGCEHTLTSVLCPSHLLLGCTVYCKTQSLFRTWCEEPQVAEQPPHEDQLVQIALQSLHRSLSILFPEHPLAIFVVPLSLHWRSLWALQLLHEVHVDHSIQFGEKHLALCVKSLPIPVSSSKHDLLLDFVSLPLHFLVHALHFDQLSHSSNPVFEI